MTGVIPAWLRAELPEEWRDDAEIVGLDVAGVSDSVRLYGPPGAAKTTQSALRTSVRAERDDLSARDMTVVTFSKALADKMRRTVLGWGAFPEPEDTLALTDSTHPFHCWGTIHAIACRTTGFLDQFNDNDPDCDVSGMVSNASKEAFCDEHNIRCHPPKPWQETPWTLFYNLYTYAKNNCLAVGEWEHLNKEGLKSIEEDVRAARKLEAFRDEFGRTEFENVVAAWEHFKRENHVCDFWEQLESALDPNAAIPPTKHVVIDEYHDAYPLMALVCERWVGAADVAVVAGDPDQTINGYAGADPDFFDRFDERVDKTLPVATLPESHRCPDKHYEAAKIMLSEARDPPELETDGEGALNTFHPSAIGQNDGDWELPYAEEPGTPVWLWEEFGPGMIVAARTQRQLTGAAACLDLSGIAYHSQDSVGGDWEARFHVLRALETVEDVRPPEQSSIINSDFDKESEHETVTGRDFQSGEAYEFISHLDRAVIDDHDALLHLVNEARRNEEVIPLEAVAEHVSRSFWERYGAGKESIDELVYMSSPTYDAAHETQTLKAAWDRYDDREFTIDVHDGTRLLTFHASKGSEATDVVVYDGITGRTHNGVREHRDVRANEARTWYVALTRASDRLHIVRGGTEWTHEHLPMGLESDAKAKARRRRGSSTTEVTADD